MQSTAPPDEMISSCMHSAHDMYAAWHPSQVLRNEVKTCHSGLECKEDCLLLTVHPCSNHERGL